IAVGQIVGVVAGDERGTRERECGRERRRQPERRRVDHAESRLGGGGAIEPGAGPVGRAVVHRDDLEVANALPRQRAQRRGEPRRGVADRHEHGDRGHMSRLAAAAASVRRRAGPSGPGASRKPAAPRPTRGTAAAAPRDRVLDWAAMAGRRLLILGGGFGGLDVARAVGRSRAAREYWDTLLVDKENFFQFNPLLPAVAVGAVETRHIVYPLRAMAQHRHIRFQKNKVMAIDLARREVRLHNDLVERFEVLVVAVGSETNYYDIPGAVEHTRPFKTIVDAMTLRARVVELFEMAEQAETRDQRRRLLSFVVVGGGVTGVEVAAELMEMARETLLPKYGSLHRSDVSVTVLEAGDRLVNTARPAHSAYVQRFLERRGVQVRLQAPVVRVDPRCVRLADGSVAEGFTLIWTAGVRPPQVVRGLPLAHADDGRVRVDPRLRALDPDGRPVEDVFVIGDCGAVADGRGGYLPRLAQV